MVSLSRKNMMDRLKMYQANIVVWKDSKKKIVSLALTLGSALRSQIQIHALFTVLYS